MTTKKLSQPTLDLINKYLHLSFEGKDLNCPYFNNKRVKVRAGLRVMIGKGSVDDIMEEAMIIALREKVDLKNLSSEQIKKFLVDHKIGIDCSGFVYHILDAELQAQGRGKLKKHLKYPYVKNPLRKLLTKFRPVESAGVGTFAHDDNSIAVELKDVKPGNLIIMYKTGQSGKLNHVLLVHQVDYENEKPKTIYYTHSFQFPEDGQYDHGVRQEKIEVTDLESGLADQNWSEERTQEHGRMAYELKIRRILQ